MAEKIALLPAQVGVASGLLNFGSFMGGKPAEERELLKETYQSKGFVQSFKDAWDTTFGKDNFDPVFIKPKVESQEKVFQGVKRVPGSALDEPFEIDYHEAIDMGGADDELFNAFGNVLEEQQRPLLEGQNEIAVGGDGDQPEQNDFGAQANRDVPPIDNLLRLLDSMNLQKLQALLQILTLIGSYLIEGTTTDGGGNVTPDPETPEQEELIRRYKEKLPPIHKDCRRYIYWENGKLKNIVLCEDGKIKISK